MSLKIFRRYGWAIYLFIGALALIMFLLATFVFIEGQVNNLLTNLSAELLGVAFLFFLVNQFFQYDPEGESQRQLNLHISKMGELLEKATDKMTSFQIFPTRKATLDSSVAALEKNQWERMRVFAPVGLWEKDENKTQWLEAIAKHAKTKRVREVWGVFGLPPITRYGTTRPFDDVVQDLKHTRKLLGVFQELGNVELHFYPPSAASVGVGAIILENMDKTGGDVAFGLASHGSEEVVDTGFGIDDNQLFFLARDWFDGRIFHKATRNFILHDEDKSIDERWAGIVEAWYGKEYLSDHEKSH